MSDGVSQSPVVPGFIASVRRRIFVIRVAESVGLAVAIASGAGLMLMPIAWWRGISGIELAESALFLGFIVGLVWGISRRPTAFEAAAEADRQLHLHDLLATVLFLQNRDSDSQWGQAVVAAAEARCRVLRPSSVVAARLNLRAWGGVAISAGLVLTLGMFITHPANSQAAAAGSDSNSTFSQDDFQTNNSPDDGIQSSGQDSQLGRPAGSNSQQEESNRTFATNRTEDSSADQTSASADSKSSQAGQSDRNGAGAGLALSHNSAASDQLMNHSGGKSTDSKSGPIRAGNGQAVKNGQAGDDSGGTVASNPAGGRKVPPWETSEWAADSAAADSAIESGRVSQDDVDLVKDYFQRD